MTNAFLVRAFPCLAAALAVATASAACAEELLPRNWFNDPFFEIGNGMPQCPVPRGPLMTEQEMKSESHSRVERGTSCWMAGKCEKPNAYMYDAAIAGSIRERLAKTSVLDDAHVWITVKRRFAWAEGCVPDMRLAGEIEALLKSVPDVERVIVNVMPGAKGKPPYPVLK